MQSSRENQIKALKTHIDSLEKKFAPIKKKYESKQAEIILLTQGSPNAKGRKEIKRLKKHSRNLTSKFAALKRELDHAHARYALITTSPPINYEQDDCIIM